MQRPNQELGVALYENGYTEHFTQNFKQKYRYVGIVWLKEFEAFRANQTIDLVSSGNSRLLGEPTDLFDSNSKAISPSHTTSKQHFQGIRTLMWFSNWRFHSLKGVPFSFLTRKCVHVHFRRSSLQGVWDQLKLFTLNFLLTKEGIPLVELLKRNSFEELMWERTPFPHFQCENHINQTSQFRSLPFSKSERTQRRAIRTCAKPQRTLKLKRFQFHSQFFNKSEQH